MLNDVRFHTIASLLLDERTLRPLLSREIQLTDEEWKLNLFLIVFLSKTEKNKLF